MNLRYEAEARDIQERYGLSDEQVFWWDQKKQDNRELVYQFYPSTPEEAFIHSGRPVFSLEHLRKLTEKFARQPKRIENGISIWEEPDNEKTYGIGVDTAEGLEHGDNSSIDVICRESGEQVAQITGKIAPHELAEKIAVVARMYKEHLCVIERNNHGHTVIAYAKEYPEIRLYQRQEKDKITDKTTLVVGWDTNEKSKALAINSLAKDLEDGECIPHAHESYDECRIYVHAERGKLGGMPGKKDDRVISLALARVACREMILLGSSDPAAYGIY